MVLHLAAAQGSPRLWPMALPRLSIGMTGAPRFMLCPAMPLFCVSILLQVSGSVDAVVQLGSTPASRAAALEQAEAQAVARAEAAGAAPGSCHVVVREEIPLAYLPGDACRLVIKAVGDLQLGASGAGSGGKNEGGGRSGSGGAASHGRDGAGGGGEYESESRSEGEAATGPGAAPPRQLASQQPPGVVGGVQQAQAQPGPQNQQQQQQQQHPEQHQPSPGPKQQKQQQRSETCSPRTPLASPGPQTGQAPPRLPILGRPDEPSLAELAAWQPTLGPGGEWIIREQDLHLIAVGTGILGTGGGGSPHKAKLKALLELQR